MAQANQSTSKHFTITGYYSPLPNQNFYITGGYESEIRLNGQGIRGADFTPVYPGMMAGPPHYKFGTKVCVPNFGCGAIHDRGQAIVAKGERNLAQNDRLDLWMGYGDEGLIRALAWGVQNVECEIYPENSNIAENVNFSVPTSLIQLLNLPAKSSFENNLSLNSNHKDVAKIKEILKELNFYEGEINNHFDQNLENSILKFQKKNFIIETNNDLGAGIFGPQTREKISQIWNHTQIQNQISQMWEEFHFEENLKRGERNASVLKLQEILVKTEHMEVSPTGFFGPKTEQALIEFQIANDIIQNENDLGSGRVGPITSGKLNNILEQEKQYTTLTKSKIWSYQKSHNKLNQLVQQNLNISQALAAGDEGNEVFELQKIMQDLGYLKATPTGYFGSQTKKAVYNFQLDKGIISQTQKQGAGIFGSKTLDALKQIVRG